LRVLGNGVGVGASPNLVLASPQGSRQAQVGAGHARGQRVRKGVLS